VIAGMATEIYECLVLLATILVPVFLIKIALAESLVTLFIGGMAISPPSLAFRQGGEAGVSIDSDPFVLDTSSNGAVGAWERSVPDSEMVDSNGTYGSNCCPFSMTCVARLIHESISVVHCSHFVFATKVSSCLEIGLFAVYAGWFCNEVD
jgi:hypothetical protein